LLQVQPSATIGSIHDCRLEHHVLVVRGQQFTPPQFIAAAQVFGELFQHDKREMHVRAGQAALHFARYAAGVNMVVREDSLSLYMSEYLIERIGTEPKVKVLLNTEVTALHGDPVLGSDLLKGDKPPESGVLDRKPYAMETSLPGVFAAGDVRAGSIERCASAVGEGAWTIASVHRYLADG
jgi:thioredoxin reductase